MPEGLSEREFFEGFSIPRNKELMLIFKDIEKIFFANMIAEMEKTTGNNKEYKT